MELKYVLRTLAFAVVAAVGAFTSTASAQEKLRFAVGPFQPTATDTRKAYEPFFKHIADKLGREYELVVTTDWAGIGGDDAAPCRRLCNSSVARRQQSAHINRRPLKLATRSRPTMM